MAFVEHTEYQCPIPNSIIQLRQQEANFREIPEIES